MQHFNYIPNRPLASFSSWVLVFYLRLIFGRVCFSRRKYSICILFVGAHGSRRNIPTPAWLKFTQLPAADMVYIHIEIYMYMPHSSSRSRCLQKTMPHVACRLAHLIKSLLRYLFNISLLFIDTFTMCEGCGKFLAVNHMRNKIGSITMRDWLSAFN